MSTDQSLPPKVAEKPAREPGVTKRGWGGWIAGAALAAFALFFIVNCRTALDPRVANPNVQGRPRPVKFTFGLDYITFLDAATAVTLIGKNVKAVSDTANISNGQAQWTYNLPTAASDLKVEVLDGAGNVLHAEAPTNLGAGDHAFTWNGKNLAGTQLPNGGPYTLRVTATDSTGAAVASTNYVQGVVTGVTQANGSTSITVNGGPVDWSKVVSVNQPTSATS